MNYVPNILCTVWEKFVEPLLRALIKIHSHLAKKNYIFETEIIIKNRFAHELPVWRRANIEKQTTIHRYIYSYGQFRITS